MKKFLVFALCAMTLVACKKDPADGPGPGPGPGPGDPELVTIKATVDANSFPTGLDLTALGFAFAANDPVSVVFNKASAASSFKVGTVAADGSASVSGSLKWPAFGTKYDFYAYMNGGTYSAPNANVPSPVFSGDVNNSHFKNAILMVATPVEATSPAEGATNSPVEMAFHNLMSFIEVAVAATDAETTISKIEIVAENNIFPTDGKVDVSAAGTDFGKITAETKVATTSLAVSGSPVIPVADNAEKPTNGTKLYLPTAAAGESGKLTVKITTSLGPQEFVFDDGFNFEAGKLYKMSVVLEGATEPLAKWDGKTFTKPSLKEGTTTVYLIDNGEHLAWISRAWNESTKATPEEAFKDIPKFLEGLTFELTNSIDLNNHNWAVGSGTEPINFMIGGTHPTNTPFLGTLDGGGHTIQNFYIDIKEAGEKSKVYGVMGLVRLNGGIVCNLTVKGKIEGVGIPDPKEGSTVACTHIAAICARNDGANYTNDWRGKIINCHSDVDINVTNVTHVAGITGMNGRKSNRGLVEGCTNRGNIKVTAGVEGTHTAPLGTGIYVGGITGYVQAKDAPAAGDTKHGIHGCRNYGDVESDATANPGYIGGVVGELVTNGIMQQCVNEGKVTGGNVVGGVAGRVANTHSHMVACYNTGEVTGTSLVGGVVGLINRGSTATNVGTITACYNIGKVTGKEDDTTGGVCGKNMGFIYTSYWGGADPLEKGIGKPDYEQGSHTANLFTAQTWPTASMAGWKLVSEDGYWQSRGSAPSTYPTLP